MQNQAKNRATKAATKAKAKTQAEPATVADTAIADAKPAEPINPKAAAAAEQAGQIFKAVMPNALAVFVNPAKAGHLRDRAIRGSANSSPASKLRAAATLQALAIYNSTSLRAIADSAETATLPLYIDGKPYAIQSGAASDTVARIGSVPMRDHGTHGALSVSPSVAAYALSFLPQAARV